MAYDLQTITAPRMAGTALSLAASALENPLGMALLGGKLMRDAGIQRLREQAFAESPSVVPPLPRPATLGDASAGAPLDLEALLKAPVASKGFRFESIADFAQAYREGKSNPERVADL